MYASMSELHQFLLVVMEIWRDIPCQGTYKEIIRTNVKHGGRNSTDKNGTYYLVPSLTLRFDLTEVNSTLYSDARYKELDDQYVVICYLTRTNAA